MVCSECQDRGGRSKPSALPEVSCSRTSPGSWGRQQCTEGKCMSFAIRKIGGLDPGYTALEGITSQSLNFLICKMRIIIVSAW